MEIHLKTTVTIGESMKKRLACRKKMHFEVIFVGGVSDGEVRTCGGVHQRF